MIGSLRTLWHWARPGHRVGFLRRPDGMLTRCCSCGDVWWP